LISRFKFPYLPSNSISVQRFLMKSSPVHSLARKGCRQSSILRWSLLVLLFANSITRLTAQCNAPAIASQPKSEYVQWLCQPTLSVTASGTQPFVYQWFKDGIAIPGATAASYTLPPVTHVETGRYNAVVFNDCGGAVSAGATIVVSSDTGPPRLVNAATGITPDQVVLDFDFYFCKGAGVGLDPASAAETSNYVLHNNTTGGTLVINNAQPSCSDARVVLTTSRLTDGTSYTITVNEVMDVFGNVIQPGIGNSATFRAGAITRGFLWSESFWNIQGSALGDLTNSAAFPYCADQRNLLTTFEAPRNGGNNFGQRLVGYIMPTTTGNHYFWISSSHPSALFLGTDENPSTKVLIASSPGGTAPRAWNCSGAACQNPSVQIALDSSKRYYIEALMKESGQADHLAVAWQVPGGAAPRDGLDVLGPAFFGAYAAPTATQLNITLNPASVTAAAGCRATFTVVASTQPPGVPVAYQWQRNSQDVPGANSPTLVTDYLSLNDNQTVYRCFLRAPGQTRNTVNAFLTVTTDITAPALSAAASYSPLKILAFFNEAVLPGVPANYQLNGGRSIAAVASYPGDKAVVELTVNAGTPLTPGTRYQLTVTGIADSAGNPVSPSPTTVEFVAQAAQPASPLRTIRLTPVGTRSLVEWIGEGVLQASDATDGSWTDLPEAASPHVAGTTPSPCGGIAMPPHKFYRVRLP
jgi:hypothetical protein